MKRKFLKNILACVMVYALTAADVVPVLATEMQTADAVMLEAEASPEEMAGEEEANTEAEAMEANEAVPFVGDDDIDLTDTPSITQPTIRVDQYSSYVYFHLDYTGTNIDACELTVQNSNGIKVYEESYYSGGGIDSDDFNYSLVPGMEYTFTLKPFTYDTDSSRVYGEEKSIAWTASVPEITQPTISATSYSSYVVFKLNYTSSNASYCKLTVTASNTNAVVYSDSSYSSGSEIDSDDFSQNLASGVRYTFTLTPTANGVDGTPKSVAWAAPTVPTIAGLTVKEMTPSGFVFSHSAVSADTAVYFEYADNAAFTDVSRSGDSISYDDLEAGVTYYVRAYARLAGIKGGYSNVVTVTVPIAEITGISTDITNTSITLTMYAGYGDYTGFEVSRKIGKKYQKLTTTADRVFADQGLENDTTYKYRVRAIYYDVNTKKTSYGDYFYKTVTTGKAVLNLKADATGKNKIQLKWTKIPGAAGYDVYRSMGSSSSNTYKSGENYNFNKYELVKSLGKKKKSYTDKKLTAGETYSYIVKAYKMVKGQKRYFVEASVSASTKFGFSTSVNIYKSAQNPKTGTMAIAWKRIPQAGGYLIEKYDSDKSEWVVLARLKVSKTSYTLPASPLGKTIRYRVRAYKGNKYSGSDTVDVTGHIAVVTGVKAASTANGVQVSWNAVAGASYYRVYRTTSSSADYDADLKTYGYINSSQVYPRAFKAAGSETTNYYYTVGTGTAKMSRDYDAEEKLSYRYPNNGSYLSNTVVGTSIIDYSYATHSIVEGKDDVHLYGPQSGVTYNYYVVAYAVQRDMTVTDYESYTTASSYGNSKAASVTYAGSVSKLKAPTVKVKAGKKKATLTIKKVSGASGYAIYRSMKKKGSYQLVGVTTKAKFTDSGLTSKKKYYYKVKAVGKSSIGTDVYSSFSKVKNMKAK